MLLVIWVRKIEMKREEKVALKLMGMTHGWNLHVPPILVRHQDLKRRSEDSNFKSICPICEEGTLFVQRDQRTFRLLPNDMCILCGQSFVYHDIAEMSRGDWREFVEEEEKL